MSEETEEDFKVRVLDYLRALGIVTSQLRLERSVRLQVGRQTIELADPAAPVTLRGRYDLLVVNDAGKNVILAELKRPGTALTVADRDQAIYYARLQPQMPPLVFLSSGLETRLYDVMTLEEVAAEQVTSQWSRFGSGIMTVTADDLRLREEALQYFIGFSPENVSAFCAAQQKDRMAGLRAEPGSSTKKYLPPTYVARQKLRNAFVEFLASPAPVFVLAGPSGIGKTNEVCAIAEAFAAADFALFFSGSELSDFPAKVLAEEFNWQFSEQLVLPTLCDRLVALGRAAQKRLLVFIDGIDESPLPLIERAISDTVFQFGRHAGALKLVLSLKSNQWERFASFGDGESPLARLCFRPVHPLAGPERPFGGPSFELEPLEPSELDEALRKYESYFDLADRIRGELRQLARDPFMLRIISEVCAAEGHRARTLSRDPTPLLKRYLDQKLSKMPAAARSGVTAGLSAVARALLEASGVNSAVEPHSVSEAAALLHADMSGWLELPPGLFDAGLLVRERDVRGRARVAFQYDRLRDYIISYHVLQLDTLTAEQFTAAVEPLFQNAMGRSALWTYLQAPAEPSHEAALQGRAHRSATRFLSAYDSIRQAVGRILRSHMSPRTAGEVGLVFSFHGHDSWTYGFFARQPPEPSVVARPNYWNEWEELLQKGGSEVPLADSVHQTTAWPMLLDPERVASEIAIEQIRKALSGGGLDESVSEQLEVEKVLAITGRHRRELDLPRPPWPISEAASELGSYLLPIDVSELRTRVHAALGGTQAYYDALSRHATLAEADEARRHARSEAASGKRFYHPANRRPVPPLAILAEVLDRLADETPVIDNHYLPLPDLEPAARSGSELRFEDGYSDARLAELIARIWVARLDEYARVAEANFPGVARRLPRYAGPPEHFIVLSRRARGPEALGLGASLRYAELEWYDPFPIEPGGAVVSGPRAKVQVFPWSEGFRFDLDERREMRLFIPSGGSITLARGWGEMGLSGLLYPHTWVPLGWNSEQTYGFLPLRNAVYEFLIRDFQAIEPATLLPSGLHETDGA